jgi:hypothetical protein
MSLTRQQKAYEVLRAISGKECLDCRGDDSHYGTIPGIDIIGWMCDSCWLKRYRRRKFDLVID